MAKTQTAYSPSLTKGEEEPGIAATVYRKEYIAVHEELDNNRPALLHNLNPFAHMWEGRLGHFKETDHRIELTPKATPMLQPPIALGPHNT